MGLREAYCASEDDEPHAYRKSPSETTQYTAFFFVDRDGALKAGLPRGLNFGLKLALLQYSPKPELVAALRRLFLIMNAHAYVDDYQLPEYISASACPVTLAPPASLPQARRCSGRPFAEFRVFSL
jgi:hypothetical protein